MKECKLCEKKAGHGGFAQGLVKVYSREKVPEEQKTVNGKVKPTYSSRERWVCIECLLTRVAQGSFEDALDFAEVEKR